MIIRLKKLIIDVKFTKVNKLKKLIIDIKLAKELVQDFDYQLNS